MKAKTCWICRRTFDEALREFNDIISSSDDEELKSKITPDNEINENQYFVEGKLYPHTIMDTYFIDVVSIEKGENKFTKLNNKQVGIPLCDVCLCLVESIELNGIDYVTERFVSRDDMDVAQIKLILPESDEAKE